MRSTCSMSFGIVGALSLGAIAFGQGLTASSVRTGGVGLDHLETVDGRVAFLRSSSSGEPLRDAGGVVSRSPADAVERFGPVFGVVDSASQLRLRGIAVDAIGYQCATYDQVHRGVPVFSGILRVHRDETGRVCAMNGDVYTIPVGLEIAATVTEAEAIGVLARAMVLQTPETERSDLVIVDPGWYGDMSLGARLAYYVVLRDPDGFRREAAFIDARSGAVLDRWDMIHRVKDRQIHDGLEEGGIPGDPARFEGDAATGDFDIDAAYDYYSDTYDYFFRAFGRDSIDDAGMPMVATVHSTAPGCPNAFWNGQQMVFCTGLVTDDVVGHELAHGVTQFTAALIYQNQPGQLNESFSDVFGELIDLFNGDVAAAGAPGGLPGGSWPAHPTGPGFDLPNNSRSFCSATGDGNPDGVRWLIGEDAVFGAIRDMWDPTCRFHPDRADSERQQCQLFDVGGVHLGSGVPNHAFAIVTDGKTFNGRAVSGVGAIKSGAVWYRALTTYLTPSSDFQDAFFAFTQAATDLIGTFPNDPRTGLPSTSMFTAFDADQVREALLAVEMDGDGACGSFPDVLPDEAAPACDSPTVLLVSDFEAGPTGWRVENSAPTPYDWELIASLPHGRAGIAYTVANGPPSPSGDETGTHDLISPMISPPGAGPVVLRFTHLMRSESHFDGGVVSVREVGGDWQDVPAGLFVSNGYNAILVDANEGGTNPAGGSPAFSGAGGTWGASAAMIDPLLSGDAAFEVRFRFAKDQAVGEEGWMVDDVTVERCSSSEDCDGNGVPDEIEVASSSVVVERVPTASTAFFSDLDPRGDGESSIVAQRFELLTPTTPERVRFWGAYYPGDLLDGGFDLAIYDADPSNSNLPGSVVLDATFGAGAVGAVQTGQFRFGVQIYEFTLDLPVLTELDAGTYWLGISGDSPGSDDTFIWFTSWVDSGFTNIAGTSDVSGVGWGASSSFWSLSMELTAAAPVGPAPSCDTDGSGIVDVLDLLGFLSGWFPLNGSAVGPGEATDVDGSGVVDVLDLLAFLGCWFPASSGASPCP